MLDNKHSLIVRLPNWVGDALMTLPTLQALHTSGFELHLCGKPWAKDLFSATNWHLYAYPQSKLAAIKYLKQIPVKSMLLFTNSFSSAFVGKLARKKTIGYKTDGRHLFLSKSIKKTPGKHEAEYDWQIGKLASEYHGLDFPQRKDFQSQLPLSDLHHQRAELALTQANVRGDYWVLCSLAAGFGKDGKPKIWPHWRELFQLLQRQGKQLVACPTPHEENTIRQLLPDITLLRNLTLSEYAAVLQNASCVIANDTGPMHLAAAVHANVLGLFGVSDPQRTSPLYGRYLGQLDRWPTLNEVLDLIEF